MVLVAERHRLIHRPADVAHVVGARPEPPPANAANEQPRQNQQRHRGARFALDRKMAVIGPVLPSRIDTLGHTDQKIPRRRLEPRDEPNASPIFSLKSQHLSHCLNIGS